MRSLSSVILLVGMVEGARAQFGAPAFPGEAGQIEILQSDPNPGSRQQAARQLGLRGTQAAIPALAQAAAFDAERQVRAAAGDAIALIRRRGVGAWIGRPPLGQNDQRALVESWYQLYLHRPSDPAGMRDYLDRLRRGADPLEVQAAFLGSDEYFRLHNSRNRSWVVALYADVLDRSPTPREINHWVQSLNRSGGARDGTALEFLRAAQAELAQRNR
jgi:hypothetical protein